MSTRLKLRRGTGVEHSAFTGESGEITLNTSTKAVVVHDGSTAGGVQMARADLANVGPVAADIIPAADVTYSLGSPTKRWADLYVGIHSPPKDATDIYVVGKQWMWKIEHPGGQREIDTLHVPVG